MTLRDAVKGDKVRGETRNAVIIGTMLGIEDHGILTCYVYLDYGDSGHQGFGGYSLDGPRKDGNGKHLGRFGSAFGMEFIRRLLDTLGVETWEKLKGTPCRVVAEYSKVHAIGHFTKNKWFDPAELAKEYPDAD
jgi:hypothetical protein